MPGRLAAAPCARVVRCRSFALYSLPYNGHPRRSLDAALPADGTSVGLNGSWHIYDRSYGGDVALRPLRWDARRRHGRRPLQRLGPEAPAGDTADG